MNKLSLSLHAIACLLAWLFSGFANATNCGPYNPIFEAYINPELGIEFCFPAGMFVRTEGHDIYVLQQQTVTRRNATYAESPAEVMLNGKRLVEPYDYVVHIKVGHGDFTDANSRLEIFDCDNSSCRSKIGRFKPVLAEAVRGFGWKGYMADIICSSEDRKTGFHAAGGTCLWVVGSDSQRSFVLDTLGDVTNARLARRVIKSLRLMKVPQRTNGSFKPTDTSNHTR